MRSYKLSNLQEIMDSLQSEQSESGREFKAIPLAEPQSVEIHRQSRRLLEQIAHDPDNLLGVISANFQRLREGDIDAVFPDRRATAWLRAMHMLSEVAARLYEQNPYEFSQLERIAGSLQTIEEYVQSNRHCPPELRRGVIRTKTSKTLN